MMDPWSKFTDLGFGYWIWYADLELMNWQSFVSYGLFMTLCSVIVFAQILFQQEENPKNSFVVKEIQRLLLEPYQNNLLTWGFVLYWFLGFLSCGFLVGNRTDWVAMVLLHVKQKDDRQFLYESSGKESVDAIVRELVVVNNLQVRILGLKEEGKQLALHGPFKAPRESDEDDSDDDEESANKKPRGPFYCRDPSGHRTGEGTPKKSHNMLQSPTFFFNL